MNNLAVFAFINKQSKQKKLYLHQKKSIIDNVRF